MCKQLHRTNAVHVHVYACKSNAYYITSRLLIHMLQSSKELKRALSLFEKLLSNSDSYCQLADGARILGEKRVCRIDVNIHFGQSTVLYCLEGEELTTALQEISNMVRVYKCILLLFHNTRPSEARWLGPLSCRS